MHLAFKIMDRNGDGSISVSDAFDWMGQLGKYDYHLNNDVVRIIKRLKLKEEDFTKN